MTVSKEQLEVIIERLSKAQNYQRGAWQVLIEKARRYAQMKVFGSYLDDRGNSVSVCHSDRERMTGHFADYLLQEAERAFAEDAQMGVAISDNLG